MDKGWVPCVVVSSPPPLYLSLSHSGTPPSYKDAMYPDHDDDDYDDYVDSWAPGPYRPQRKSGQLGPGSNCPRPNLPRTDNSLSLRHTPFHVHGQILWSWKKIASWLTFVTEPVSDNGITLCGNYDDDNDAKDDNDDSRKEGR